MGKALALTRTVAASLLWGSVFAAYAEAPQYIDTQAQFDPVHRNYAATLETMLHEMDRVGIRRMFIVPPPMPHGAALAYDAEEIARAIKDHPTRFSFLAGGGSLNGMIQKYAPDEVTDEVKTVFRRRCDEILALGALGFGEITAEHLAVAAGMGDIHASESAPPDHPLLLLLADIAAEKDVPIDFHFDVIPADMPTPPMLRRNNPPELKENLQAFERLLAHNRKARFNWAHAGRDPLGQRTPLLMRQLLERHPNLYSALLVAQRGPRPTIPLDEGGQLKPQWLKLIQDFPDRFTIHSDMFYTPRWPPERGPKDSHELARQLLEQLPPDLAAKVAYGTAVRIYKLKD